MRRRLGVAESAMKAALSSMDSKEGMMHLIETGTKHLSLLVNLGKNAAEVRSFALCTLRSSQSFS